jgi:hypothetical protein
MGTTAYAADATPSSTIAAEAAPTATPTATTETATSETAANTLTVDEVWLTGDTLHITVTDKEASETQTLEMKLSDYAKSGDEYVTVQATDSAGRTSNSIKFKNPYYQATVTTEPGAATTPSGTDTTDVKPSESAVSDGANPFTPDGTGSVVDNATDGDGKEFFTVETADGNVFYLIVDRQRDTDNVYLLNAVTENDLGSLAKPGDGTNVSAVETPQATPEPTTTPSPVTTEQPEPEKNGGSNTAMYILIFVAVLAVGGIGYYVKIVRPKQNAVADDDDYDEPDDDDDSSFNDDEELDFDGRSDDEGGEDE